MAEPISNTELDISSLSDIVDLESTQNDIESSMSESSSWDVSSSELPVFCVSAEQASFTKAIRFIPKEKGNKKSSTSW